MLSVVKWIIMVFAVALLGRPALIRTKLKYVDGGFGLNFGIGSGLSFLLAWLFCASFSIPFGNAAVIISFIILALGLNLYSYKFDRESFVRLWNRSELVRFLFGFLAFVLLFSFAVWIKGYRPEIDGQTEKYMDFGIMQSIYRQESAWPEDFWMSGSKLNYYFLGLSASTYLTRLAFVTPTFGYNFMLCTLFAISLMMVFELVSSLIIHRQGSVASVYIGGVFGSLGAVCAGNGHYILFGIVVRILKKIFGENLIVKDYWFPDSTVYIGTNPEVGDFGKHEFPGYTMILGDLHAHLVNMLWTLPFLAVLIDYALRDKTKEKGIKHFFDVHIIVMGLLLGIFRGSNFWDFPIYYVIAGGIILFTELCAHGVKPLTFLMVLTKGVVMYAIAFVGTLPFSLGFKKMISGICIAHTHSQFYKMVIIWGIPFVAATALILWVFVRRKGSIKLLARIDLIEIALALCAMGLVIVPELIYVKDIYGEQYTRFNTMFKLTYQAFILFGIISGILMGRIIALKKWKWAVSYGLILLILSSYIFTSGKVWLYKHGGSFKGLSVLEATLKDEPEDKGAIKEAVNILLKDERKDIRLLEGVGGDYTDSNCLSSFTGVPTVEGWPVHEWLWQNSYDPVGARTEEVRSFYEDGNVSANYEMLQKYGIDYIFVGKGEYELYNVNPEGFLTLTDEIFKTENGYMFLKVKK